MSNALPEVAINRFQRCWPYGVSIEQVLFVIGACILFMAIGPTLMMLNKHIMQGIGFDYPLSLSCLGLLTSAVGMHCIVALGLAKVRSESLDVVSGRNWFRIALPIGLCKAVSLATGNAVYLYLGVGFIQMLKAFTPVVVYLVMKLFGTAAPPRAAVWFVLVIVAGTLIEVKGNMDVSIVGLMLMMTSETTEAISLVLTQHLLQECKFNIVEGLYLLAPPGAACLLLAAAILEWPRMLRDGGLRQIAQFPSYFVLAALVGFGVNFVGYLLVQATSSLTVKILNVVRCAALVIVGVAFYGETCTSLQLSGYVVALFGFAGYNYVQLFHQSAFPCKQTASTRQYERRARELEGAIDEMSATVSGQKKWFL